MDIITKDDYCKPSVCSSGNGALLKKNFLGEFSTSYEKEKARQNLGIDFNILTKQVLKNQDFINITHTYNIKDIPISEAIKYIPPKYRKEGQIITFINEEDKWVIYQFKGEVPNQWNNITLWDNLYKINFINSTIPDDEDLELTTPDEEGNSKIKFKDRRYIPEEYSGKGYKILRKNIVEIEDSHTHLTNIINYLYQDMIDQPNTIYEIRYDFDLNGQEITIPEGCILKFEGGSLSNGIIKGEYENNYDLTIENFGAKCDGVTDDSDALQRYINYCTLYRDNFIKLPPKTIAVSKSFIINNINNTIKLIGSEDSGVGSSIRNLNENRIYTGTIIKDINDNLNTESTLFTIIGTQNDNFVCKNIKFYGNRSGNRRRCFELNNVGYDGIIDNIEIRDFWAGAIWFDKCYDIFINNIAIKYCSVYFENDNIVYPALKFYSSREESYSNCNALKFNNFHMEHCNRFIEFEAVQLMHFTNGKFENMYGAISYEEPFETIKFKGAPILFKNTGKHIVDSITIINTQLKFQNSSYIYNSNPNIKYKDIEPLIKFDFTGLNSGNINFIGCLFISDGQASKYILCNENTHKVNITGCTFSFVEEGCTSLTFNGCNVTGCTFGLSYDTGRHSIDEDTKGKPILFLNNNIFTNNTILSYRKDDYPIYAFTLNNNSKNNIIENNKINLYIDNYPNIDYVLFNPQSTYNYRQNKINNIQKDILLIGNEDISEIDFNKPENSCNLLWLNKSCNITLNNLYKDIRIFSIAESIITVDGIKYTLPANSQSVLRGYNNKKLDINIDTINNNISCNIGNRGNIAFFANGDFRKIAMYDGTKWIDAFGNNIEYYTHGTTSQRPNSPNINFKFFDTLLNKPIWWNGINWIDSNGIQADLKIKGSTSQRPSLTSIDEGFEYYDSTLKKKILWNGTTWVNLDGTLLE